LPATNHPTRRVDGIERAADVLGDRWTMLVLREAYYGVRRFGEMARNLGIARNVLAARLKGLVASGVLEKRRYRTDPDWYEYVLTAAGRDLYGAIIAVLHWSDVHLAEADSDERLRLRHRPCGHVTYAKVVCAACGEALDPREVDVESGDRGGA
jgi:DNA-binding HxlR family transcriptional regulator